MGLEGSNPELPGALPLPTPYGYATISFSSDVASRTPGVNVVQRCISTIYQSQSYKMGEHLANWPLYITTCVKQYFKSD